MSNLMLNERSYVADSRLTVFQFLKNRVGSNDRGERIPELTACIRKLCGILNAMPLRNTRLQTPALATSTSTMYCLYLSPRARYLNTIAASIAVSQISAALSLRSTAD